MFSPPGREHDVAQRLRENAPHAQPNPRIVAFADALLDRDGRMLDAIDAMGPAEIVFEGRLFALPLTL
jgi:predicted protein tyrosine phosphatase